ncbi:MAG: phage tail tube protein [Janthinobacterium lividum]
MASVPYAGTLFMRIDGVQRSLDGDWKVQPNNVEYTGVAGPSGVIGRTAKYVVPSISGTLADSGDFAVKSLPKISASTITLELVNGKTYVLSQAWWSGSSEVDVMEGKIGVKFEGFTCTELVAA